MDPMQEIELKVLRLQKPMNEVIERRDSPVQKFYDGTTVLVTGGSGFMGKHLVEKLFRSCAIRKMYFLLRSKKGKTIQERLQSILSDPVYDLLRTKQPQFADRIEVIEGNVADFRLGLSGDDWTKLTEEVNVIFHAAASVRFNEPLQTATLINVRGTRDSLELARACTNLKSYIYLSTTYTSASKDRIDEEIHEKFYEAPVSPDILISIAEKVNDVRLNKITENFIDGWPNTYTFTKAVAEEQIRTANDLPIAIVRLPIVLPSYYEPSPGWLDTGAINGVSGVFYGALSGILHVFRVDQNALLPVTPVDYANNTLIAAAWDAQLRRKLNDDTDVPIYTISNKDYFPKWSLIGHGLRENFKLCSDKALYMCGIVECKTIEFYWLLTLLLHYIPAYILDAVYSVIGKRPAGIKSFVATYQKIDKMDSIYHYFLSNCWNFRDDNVKAMLDRMSLADRAIFNCDLSTINFSEYVKVWGLGIRKYIIKDGLNNTALGNQRQKIFKVLNYILMFIYSYVLYTLIHFSFIIIKHVFKLRF